MHATFLPDAVLLRRRHELDQGEESRSQSDRLSARARLGAWWRRMSLGRSDPQTMSSASSRSGAVRVALVLSAGGLRGAAHVGVLRGLVRRGIPIDAIVGVSAGAV